jgi:hypothetical protein
LEICLRLQWSGKEKGKKLGFRTREKGKKLGFRTREKGKKRARVTCATEYTDKRGTGSW